MAATASTEGGFEEQIKEARRQLLASLDAKADNAAKSTPSNPLFKADDGGRIGFAPPLQAPMFPPDEPERDEAGNVFEPRPRATTAQPRRRDLHIRPETNAAWNQRWPAVLTPM